MRFASPIPLVALAVITLTAAGCTAGVPTPSTSVDYSDGFTPEMYQDSAWISIMSRYPDAERPDVAVIRVVDNSEFPAVYEACMAEEGFAVTVREDTSFEATIPAGQQQPFDLAMYVCEARYPRPFLLSAGDDAADGKVLYTYYRDELLGCLAEQGFSPDPLPSETTFIETLNSTQRYDPYWSIINQDGLDIDRWNEINELCPQRPEQLD